MHRDGGLGLQYLFFGVGEELGRMSQLNPNSMQHEG
jgi:hypothetical protein